MDIILKPFALLLGSFYNLTGNYGLAIIMFCLVFKILLFPISIKGRKAMLDMSRLSEKQKELQAKYGKDRTRYSQELNELYTRENVKPSGGCLWTFIPLPLLFALYGVISAPFRHLMGLSGDQIKALTEFVTVPGAKAMSQLGMAQTVHQNFDGVKAALPEVAAQIQSAGGPINFDFFGINLSSIPDLAFFAKPDSFTMQNIGLFVIPIVSAILSVLSMRVSNHINKRVLGVGGGGSDTMNRQMMIMQPFLSLWIGFTLPAALGIYWIANSLFGMLQEYISIGILKKHLAVMKVKAEARAIEYREKDKESKRLLAEQKKQKAEEAKRIKMERSISTQGIADGGRIGSRAYAKGRTCDDNRYPVTPYRDPDEILREQAAARLEKAAAAAAAKSGKASAPPTKDEPIGMILNGDGVRDSESVDVDMDVDLDAAVDLDVDADADVDVFTDDEDAKV